MSKRNDIHCPSKIIPCDYEYVALGYCGPIFSLEDCAYIQEQRAIRKAHMDRTGGKFSGHEHGGNCMCCGAHCIYDVIFYHKNTNSYLRVGTICAEKLELSFDDNQSNLFRKQIRQALKIAKGRKVALEILTSKGLTQAWEIYNAKPIYLFEENTITNIVGNLIRYAKLSDKQENFVRNLITKINDRAKIAQKRIEEKQSAADCPTGRVQFKGEVISVKLQNGFYGSQLKILVKSETGFMAYGTLPSNLQGIERGCKLEFQATFSPKADDTKFGYFKRPSKAKFDKETSILEDILENSVL